MFFKLFEDDTAGARHDRLSGVRPQEQVQRHTVEHVVETFVLVPVLGAPVPLMVEQLVDVLALSEKQEREEDARMDRIEDLILEETLVSAADKEAWRRWAFEAKRKRKKRRKKKLPKASSGRRSCDHAARVPAVQVREGENAAETVPRQIARHSSCASDGYSQCKTVQMNGRPHRSRGAADVLVNMQRQVPAVRRSGCCCAETIVFPHVQFLDKAFDARRQVPGVQTLQKTVEVPQLRFVVVVIDIPVATQRQLPVWGFTAVNMQRQVPAVLVRKLARAHFELDFSGFFEPSSAHSCACSRPPGVAGTLGVGLPGVPPMYN